MYAIHITFLYLETIQQIGVKLMGIKLVTLFATRIFKNVCTPVLRVNYI